MRVGSLCTGILGLDRAVAQHFGAEMAWYSEIEPAPITVIEREHPGVPNLGDLKQIDWATVPPVDVLTAGYPCQPFSHAGKRKGKDDPRHLWPFIAEAVRVLRPRRVVLENVAGHLSLGFGTVLGDLAEAGYDTEWCLLRASDVGAPHHRARVFIVAARDHRPPANPGGERHGGGQDGGLVGRVDGRDAGEAQQRERARAVASDRSGPPCPRCGGPTDADHNSIQCHRCQMLWPLAPDPSDFGLERGGTTRSWRGGPENGDHPPPNAEGHQQREPFLGVGERPESWRGDQGHGDWAQYARAILRWERILGRPAPAPVDTERRLNPAFVDWMQGYPEGWTADLNRTAALKALGNAVVTQQALAALRELAPA